MKKLIACTFNMTSSCVELKFSDSSMIAINYTAVENKIPFQRHATSRVTGTDTDAFAYSNGGVASALISLPLRYMHTPVEMVHRDDVENVIKLIYETLLKIENNETFSYFK